MVLTHNHQIINKGRFFYFVFQKFRGNIFPHCGFEYLLFSSGNRQLAFGLQMSDVAGVEPSIPVNDCSSELRVFVITHHYSGAFDQNFTININFDLQILKWRANCTNLYPIAVAAGRSNHRRCFGQAVALINRQSGSSESFNKPWLDSGTA